MLKGREREIARLSRLYEVLSQVNQAIVRMSTRDELLQRICQVFVDQGGFMMAWVGWHSCETQKIVPIASWGDTKGYLRQVTFHAGERAGDRGPPGIAFCTGRPFICNDMRTDPATLAWRAEVKRSGFRAAAVFPIGFAGKVRGTFTVYADKPWHSQDKEVELLEKAAGDISFALENFARRDEHQQAEEQMRAERDFSEALLNSLPGVFYLYDQNRKFLRWNGNFERVTGYTAAEIAGMHPLDFFQDAEKLQVATRIEEVFQKGASHAEAGFVSKDRRITPYYFTGVLGRFDGRKCLIGVGIDVADQRRAEEARSESEARYRALFEHAPDGIVIADPESHYIDANASMCRMLGYTRAEFLGLHASDIVARSELPQIEPALAMIRAKAGYHREWRFRRKNGSEFSAEVIATTMPDGNLLGMVRDISERKRFEAQFLRAQRMESIGTLASGVAHDLNNVLAPILMAVGLLRLHMANDNEAGEKLLGLLEANAQRGALLVRQVLGFGRGFEGERFSVQPAFVAREIGQIIRDTFPKSIRFEFSQTEELWSVLGDPTQLHQILLNLCINARDAIPGGGRLALHLENVSVDEVFAGMHAGAHPGPHVLISVSDNGTGIPKAIRERIFEPFFTTKQPGKGTGLGLSTVHALVKSHGGFVAVESTEGRGSTFKVYLPACTTPPTEQLASIASAPRGNNELLLLADDESTIRTVSKRILEQFGYRVLLAENGVEAVSTYALRQDEIAVVITDMAMPVMDGAATIVSLRTINPGVKIIGMSGLDLSLGGNLTENAVQNVDYFLPKPYIVEDLLRAINTVLHPAGSKAPAMA